MLSAFMVGAAICVLATVACGLLRLVLATAIADRILSVQLLATGTMASLLLVDAARPTGTGAGELAIVLAMLAPVAAIGFAGARARSQGPRHDGDGP
ncbi:MAG: hypothetical protein KDA22_07420 [Phycisphaerales bacterium]|nr:hypothetical protein [Phycisphaerales bacterium]